MNIDVLYEYLNPTARLGNKKYSFIFPFVVVVGASIVLEAYVYGIARNPNSVGVPAILIFLALIIYFAFRDGFVGGFVATGATISYYFYIMYTRNYSGQQLTEAVQTTAILAVLYCFLTSTVGWLRQTIDTLIEREVEEKRRLQAIMQQLPVGVMVTDHEGRVIQTNKRLDALLGVKIPFGYQIGNDHQLLQTTTNRKLSIVSQWPIIPSLSNGKAIVGREFTIDKSDQKNISVRINSSIIKNKQGKVVAAVSIVDDITSHKEMEKRKDDFVNIASHELKTPITSMKLFIDVLLRRKKYDEKSEKILTSVKTQILRLQELVSDLLDVSRMQTGKMSFRKETFRLDQLVLETIEELRQTIIENPIEYIKHKPLTVYADKFRIMQVVTNLVTNAVKYSSFNEKINIVVAQSKGFAQVSVQDFGIGIQNDFKQKIFQRLYQVPGSQGRIFRGLGMGLYICREIIRRHRGKIWVESEKGKGSTFYFTLPLH